ncbi:DUF2818 family protein [Methylonatrum kenyense]|uniref:DUF2818 family protein n=1 Tax=Methylonatrum kenyense TaxID=455253 RepID=UPI0020C17B93|nr:DUF2818 family protein [Methylonatrum kenyense]MCK8515921.1 DUF2818 family protein [Methylonatrum kenyense]
MTETGAFLLLMLVAVVAANLPWFSERVLFIRVPAAGRKREWIRLLEWGFFYGVVAAVAAGLEYRVTGDIYPQDWEFWVTTLCLFMVFALPGFIWYHDLRHHLKKRGPKKRRAASSSD